ncbi:MAG TPA: 50S ribosomal protein L10 [Acidimicrobiales bacterium]|nr:50S ribosomal protein L10 [Acidimicrobiales bacterium]
MDNPRAEKVAVVTEVREHFQRSSAAILTEYRGLTVKDLAGLRRTLRDAGSDYKIYKNTLVRFAASDLGLAGLEDLLVGPTAIAFVDGDASSVAKALREYARTNPRLTVKGGVLGTKIMTVADATALADLPPREVVLARIAGALAAPMQTFAGLLQAVPRSFAYGLKALIDKRGGPEEAPEAAVEAAAPAEAPVEAAAPAEAAPEAPAPAAEAVPEAPAPAAEAPAAEAPAEAAPKATAPAAEAPEPEPAVAEARAEPEPPATEAVPAAEPEPGVAEAATPAEPEPAPAAAEPEAAEPVPTTGGLSEQGEEDIALEDTPVEDLSDDDTPTVSEDPEDDDDPAAPPYEETYTPEEPNVPAEVAAVHIEADSEENEPEAPITAVDLAAEPSEDDIA